MTLAADLTRDRRRAWATPGGPHDAVLARTSRWLPLGVGVLLGVMVVAPLAPRNEVSFLLDRKRVAMTEERLTVTGATYRGQDDQGRAFAVSAGKAVQHSASEPVVVMSDLTARLQMADGPASVSAREGRYDIRNERMVVNGPVTFRIGEGYSLNAAGVAIDLKTRRAFGEGGVSGEIPAGAFSAERVSADFAQRVLRLEGKAHLRMVPGKVRMPQ
ncbi:MAG: LPS export ABC transporter periplasmic protein LptC [Proteobacteria bacterium]|nr:LPS export ABC transporter periplasmic protein LptC [Pseudomonadota bacterium]